MKKENIILFVKLQDLCVSKILLRFFNEDYSIVLEMKEERQLEIVFTIHFEKSQKKLTFHYSLGYNSDGIRNSIMYSKITNLKTSKNLYLDDYSGYIEDNNVYRFYNTYSNVGNECYMMETIIDRIGDFLNKKDVRKIILTDFWVDLPIDWQGYK